jgi:hypothetical protein
MEQLKCADQRLSLGVRVTPEVASFVLHAGPRDSGFGACLPFITLTYMHIFIMAGISRGFRGRSVATLQHYFGISTGAWCLSTGVYKRGSLRKDIVRWQLYLRKCG